MKYCPDCGDELKEVVLFTSVDKYCERCEELGPPSLNGSRITQEIDTTLFLYPDETA